MNISESALENLVRLSLSGLELESSEFGKCKNFVSSSMNYIPNHTPKSNHGKLVNDMSSDYGGLEIPKFLLDMFEQLPAATRRQIVIDDMAGNLLGTVPIAQKQLTTKMVKELFGESYEEIADW